MKQQLLNTLLRSHSGRERLWRVWWLWGIPVAWLTSGLVIAAELSRVGGQLVLADWLDVGRLLIYCIWARLAWQCAHNVDAAVWTPMARLALGAGFVVMYLV